MSEENQINTLINEIQSSGNSLELLVKKLWEDSSLLNQVNDKLNEDQKLKLRSHLHKNAEQFHQFFEAIKALDCFKN